MHPTHIPIRVTTGAFILNSGVGKLSADKATQEWLHNSASTAYPFLKSISPKDFTLGLACAEIAVGSSLLLPMVSSTVAGAALTSFGSGLVGMYLRTPGMTEPDGIRPTAEGLPVAKDSWLVGAGLTLMMQGALSTAKTGAKNLGKKVREVAPFTE